MSRKIFTDEVAAENYIASLGVPYHRWDDIGRIVVTTGADIPNTSTRFIPISEFQPRFTAQEMRGFWDAANNILDITAVSIMCRIFMVSHVDLDSQELIDALNYWVSIGKLNANRISTIRA